MISKIRLKEVEKCVNQAVSLRRKIVDCRFDRWLEGRMLDKISDLIADIEGEQEKATQPEKPADAAGKDGEPNAS